MTKQVHDDDMIVISGGGEIDHIFPKPGGDPVNPRARVDDGSPGGSGPGPEAEGNNGDGSDNLFKK